MPEPERDNFRRAGPGHLSLSDLRDFSRLGLNARCICFLAIATLSAASVWIYANRILVAHQLKDAAAHNRPRGNLSDLYPRWLGARELLLHHRNPYGTEITGEIQTGYYGRPLDPARPNDPKDQQGFAYPVYVVFLLAPLIWLPFAVVHTLFYWLLALLTAASVLLWLYVLGWRLIPADAITAVVLTVGSLPVVQGIKLQQLSLLVGVLLAGAAASVASEHLFLGGALLALATIKPQLAWGLAGWLILWAISDWRMRRNFVFGFGVVMALLLAGSEFVLPRWLHMFVQAIGQYHQYTQNQSVIEVGINLFVGPRASVTLVHRAAQALAALALLLCLPVFWKLRTEDAHSAGFGYANGLALSLVVLIVPMFAPYNQVLLVPAFLLLAMNRKNFLSAGKGRGLRFGYVFTVLALAWQWIASLLLCAAYLAGSRAWAMSNWKLPFLTTLALPVLVFGLSLLDLYHRRQHPKTA